MIGRRAFLAAAPAMAWGAQAGDGARFRAKVGIGIYSLRYLAEKDLAGTLRLIRELGFEEVESGELYGRTPAAFAKLLAANRLRATSYMASWEALKSDAGKVGAEARALGARYVVCSTIPHSAKHLTRDDASAAAAMLNRWGERLRADGFTLCYHTHGTEFDALEEGTVFDKLVRETEARYVAYEMDIFWSVYGGQDPARMLRQYRGRFPLMHVKDIRKGTRLGGSPADVLEDESVALGTGIVDVRAALLAAQECGVRHYYLEDEAVDAVPQIRQSLRFLAGLR